jgi:hypothetical protein
MSDSIIVIGCHISDNKSNFLLSRLINDIINNNIDFGIVANSNISDIHYKKSKFFLFDSENDKFDGFSDMKFWFENENFRIESPFLFYGAMPNYSFGASSLFVDSVVLAKKYGYRFLHWLEYDCDLNLFEINQNIEILNHKEHSCVVYKTESESHPISGGFISLNLDELNISKFHTPKDERKRILNEYGNSSEKFINKYLLGDEKIFYKPLKGLDVKNNYNQASQNMIEFVFFKKENILNCFIKNNINNIVNYSLSTNKGKISKSLNNFAWQIIPLGEYDDITHVYFDYGKNNFYLNLNDEEEVNKYVKSNIFHIK